jgi:hypothetical protein
VEASEFADPPAKESISSARAISAAPAVLLRMNSERRESNLGKATASASRPILKRPDPSTKSSYTKNRIPPGKDPEMRRFYDRIKVRRGGKRAIVAVARKLCHCLLAIAHSGQPYRINFSRTKEN